MAQTPIQKKAQKKAKKMRYQNRPLTRERLLKRR
jgi:hypothetical protein